ncbi:DUF342 domain-containing protein [Pseudoalteromonas luteoviolacea]|uniref:Flagellar Assembly Protein A N-terminal region domain-containing protein n=1 Tax=Pseudoalteromonas luteoviolacea S4054 TaxID=1129367 RepID=A0A0F6AA14_9GAMM|nr:FapA family protein [Pseudoalteromonas luteoviolacea]AOT06973.1 hypothetical protein S4054249_03365 [Pseudoalteromonas luteoviolacea]AOT11891.1 hypothetical protein S40542_03365 [Pseudoalteromonas luteoviolacea]AOT16803.1 hypothetical protein S4054_03365 [Pseudoalteromonas luteoviolacea]KKE82691.1 hypothetical protein N479_16690 [Pseudoalteromonas luteoviolacea S4054]KZN72902.1 hypothetical protein N481_13695 [Pseudoalteromonas luteoviolacea S4047-1]
MFKVTKNGQILMDVATATPPSQAFIVEALECSPYADCEVDHDSIAAYFQSEAADQQLLVAKQKHAQLQISISEDKMQATATLTTAQGGSLISLDQAKKIIIKSGVCRGYKQALLEKLLAKQFDELPGSRHTGIIAQGRPPENGLPAKLISHVLTLKERLKQPKLREDGTVDMRDFGALSSVSPGTLLITQRPATPGKEGFTVTGDSITPVPGESFQLIAGEGTEISPTNPLELISTIAGCPSDIQNGMRVDDIFTIADVNVKSGHIEFSGSVIVTHNVEPGMKVKASGDITIMGTVESGEIISEGSIEVRGGVIGHLDHSDNDQSLTCKLIAKGNINIVHGQYTYLEARNIYIQKQANHCDIKALRTVRVGLEDNPRGKLIGGTVFDAQSVTAGEIGSPSGATMSVFLANSGVEITNKTDQCIRELGETDEQLENLQKAVEKADQLKDVERKKTLMAKISATQTHYCQQAEALENKLSELDHTLHELLGGTQLQATSALHSGVEIHIFDKTYTTNRSYPPCTAKLADGQIEIEFKI